jgi:capsular polysaccharide biosynthesis protein
VIGHDDTVFGDLHNFWPKDYPHHQVLLRARLPAPTRIDGRVAVIGTGLSDSYCHWLEDTMPRIRLLGDELQRANRIVVPSALGFQRECLEAAGVPMDRLIEPHRRMHLVADELIVPSLVPRVSRETVPYLQSLFADRRSSEPPFRRLYVSRRNTWRRRVANEDELVAALAPLGFETVLPDGLSVGEQARLFSEAEIVVGPDGGALTNIVFSQPGVVLVELFDSNYVIVGFWELTARAGGTYHVLVSDSPPTTSQWRDITVSIPELLTILEAHGITQSA